MIHRWNNVPFLVTVELAVDSTTSGPNQYIDDAGRPVPQLTPPPQHVAPPGTPVDLELDCESTGYYDAGRIWGLPEDCYPPEGEDERHVVSATLVFSPQWRIPITDRPTLNALADRFAELIDNAAVDTSAPEPEYEHD